MILSFCSCIVGGKDVRQFEHSWWCSIHVLLVPQSCTFVQGSFGVRSSWINPWWYLWCCSRWKLQALVYDWCGEHHAERLHCGSVSKPLLPVLHPKGAFIDHCAVGEVLSKEAAFSFAPWQSKSLSGIVQQAEGITCFTCIRLMLSSSNVDPTIYLDMHPRWDFCYWANFLCIFYCWVGGLL